MGYCSKKNCWSTKGHQKLNKYYRGNWTIHSGKPGWGRSKPADRKRVAVALQLWFQQGPSDARARAVLRPLLMRFTLALHGDIIARNHYSACTTQTIRRVVCIVDCAVYNSEYTETVQDLAGRSPELRALPFPVMNPELPLSIMLGLGALNNLNLPPHSPQPTHSVWTIGNTL